jgi:alpha-tubulin suppressor-like RCC1 family protein
LVAIDASGNAYGWEQNLYGAAGVGLASGHVNIPRKINLPGCNAKILQVEAGEYCFVARCESGHVYTWGHNLYGQIGSGGTGNHPQPYRVNLPSGQTVRIVGASYEGAFAVTNQGNIYAWGRNPSGSLGLTDTGVNRTPTLVIPALNAYANRIISIQGGYRQGHAIIASTAPVTSTSAGVAIIGWGQSNRIGGNSTSTQNTPITILGPSGTTGTIRRTLAAGETIESMHSRFIGSIALTSSGNVFTWGSGAFDIYGDSNNAVVQRFAPAGFPIVDIGGGKEHVYFRTSNGHVWGVGYGALNKLSLTSGTNRKWSGVVVDLPN